MSFSQPKVENPCHKFYEFKGDRGVFQYYDKELSENVELKVPAYFIVLDQLSTIKGYSDAYKSGIYSNEVHSLVNETLRVKSFKGGLRITGKYSDIKDEIKSEGGKFTKSVYALLINEDKSTEIVNFQLSGAALSSWFEFKFSQQLHIVSITGDNTREKKGSINYFKPVFKRYNMKEEFVSIAIKADQVLQQFFKERAEQQQEQAVAKETEEKTAEEVWYEQTYEKDKGAVYPNKSFNEMPEPPEPPETEPESDLPF
jgi:hypothetical protein